MSTPHYELIFFFSTASIYAEPNVCANKPNPYLFDFFHSAILLCTCSTTNCEIYMTTSLAALKFVSHKRPTQLPSVQIRRNKLVNKLQEQIQLISAKKDGVQFAPLHFRSIRDRNTGEIKRIELPKRIRPWFFTSENGKVCLQIKYGSKVIDVSGKNKPTIELANTDELVKTLELVKVATLAGELDQLLESAGMKLRDGFAK